MRMVQSSFASIKAVPMSYLRECFSYDKDKGALFWKERPRHHFTTEAGWRITNARDAGREAGSDNTHYIFINLRMNGDKYTFALHHLVWLFEGGTIPEGMQIDHKDRDTYNNHISNLRLCTVQENSRNLTVRKGTATGVLGVHFDSIRPGTKNPYAAQITVDGKKIWLGRHPTLEAATDARREAELYYFGEFAPQHEAPSGLTPEEEKWVNSIGNL